MEIDGYSDLVEIGRGGFAIVYRATQERFGRTVALKVLPPLGGLGGDGLRRFERECLAVGGLSWHPRVVPVFDAGITDRGLPFLAMDYMPKGSVWDEVVGGGALAWPNAVTIGVEVADALEAAHRRGVLHRDVKPENVLRGHLDDHLLADFGIAALTSGTASATAAVLGTASYLAPELLEGERASAQSDVYSAGSTLFTLIRGTPAFAKATDESPLATLLRVARAPVPDLRHEDVPDDLASVIERSMHKVRTARYTSAAEFAGALVEVQRNHGLVTTLCYYDRDPDTLSMGLPEQEGVPTRGVGEAGQKTLARSTPNGPESPRDRVGDDHGGFSEWAGVHPEVSSPEAPPVPTPFVVANDVTVRRPPRTAESWPGPERGGVPPEPASEALVTDPGEVASLPTPELTATQRMHPPGAVDSCVSERSSPPDVGVRLAPAESGSAIDTARWGGLLVAGLGVVVLGFVGVGVVWLARWSVGVAAVVVAGLGVWAVSRALAAWSAHFPGRGGP